MREWMLVKMAWGKPWHVAQTVERRGDRYRAPDVLCGVVALPVASVRVTSVQPPTCRECFDRWSAGQLDASQ